EGSWKRPAKGGDKDTFYVFPYDWRRDNVENARLLIRRMDQLRRALRKPNLKFNIIAHSMGGLIARYAARFGNVDIPAGAPRPTWAGAKYFDKIFLLGTPNEGSVGALDVMLNGFSYIGRGLNLPFIQDISKFDIFTIPSAYQLLPHDGTLVAYDDKLQPVNIDIYDPKTWEKYNWAVWQDSAFTKKMSPTEQRDAKAFFAVALTRAKRFQAALDAPSKAKVPVSFYLMGADCKDTENALLFLRDEKKDKWLTIFKPGDYTSADGTKLTDAQLRPLLLAMGDGEVTKRSLTGSTLAENGIRVSFSPVEDLFQCESHTRLVTNPEIQDKLLTILAGTAK
ncbi:MAG: lipase family alpha/beta hydrolase, partial [Pyrinomonadaceae bacterium]